MEYGHPILEELCLFSPWSLSVILKICWILSDAYASDQLFTSPIPLLVMTNRIATCLVHSWLYIQDNFYTHISTWTITFAFYLIVTIVRKSTGKMWSLLPYACFILDCIFKTIYFYTHCYMNFNFCLLPCCPLW